MKPEPAGNLLDRTPLRFQLAAVAIFGVLLSLVWDGATRWPAPWVIPLEEWVTTFIEWLKRDASIFGVPFKDITRGIGLGLKEPVNWADYLLVRGSKTLGLSQAPWVGVVAGMTILAHWVGGWRLALLALFSLLFVAFFNLWKDAMRTMTIVLVAVPMSAAIGLALGVWVTRSKRAASIITPMFDVMQATPHLAYLPPVAALFSFGPVSALIATVIFAMPPIAAPGSCSAPSSRAGACRAAPAASCCGRWRCPRRSGP